MQEAKAGKINNKKQSEVKTKPRAVFQGDFRKHAVVRTYICPGNENQEHENFEAFLDLVLRESDTIKSIEIIDTTELYVKHYKKTLPSFKSQYEEMIKRKLGDIENAEVKWKITEWSERTNTTTYTEARQRVAQDFKQNKYNLVTVVKNEVKPYTKFNGEQAAIDYGLEELAEFTTQKGAIVFPGKLNNILKWGLKHYKIPVSFIRYKFKEVTYSSSESLSSDDSSEELLDEVVLTPTVPTVIEKRHSPPTVVYSSSPENDDDNDRLLIQTVGSYAKKIKKQLKLGQEGELEFLSGYFQYCQAFFNTYQRKKQPILQQVTTVDNEEVKQTGYTYTCQQ